MARPCVCMHLPWREWLMSATLSSVRPGSRGILLIQVQACLMVLFEMIVTGRKKISKLLRPGKPVTPAAGLPNHTCCGMWATCTAQHVCVRMKAPHTQTRVPGSYCGAGALAAEATHSFSESQVAMPPDLWPIAQPLCKCGDRHTSRCPRNPPGCSSNRTPCQQAIQIGLH
eukprot:364209-Chlamydomonas_euryale.AAC.5